MAEDGMSPADIAAIGGCNGSMFGGEGMWIFALLILLFGGNGAFGGYNSGRGDCATTEDLMMNTQFNNLDRNVDDIANRQFTVANDTTKGICELGYTMAQQANQLSSQLADCCCTTQRAIDGVKFDMANYAASINATDTANTQKILDALSQNKIEALQNKISSLELAQATQNVVRYPNGFSYNAGPSPFCGNNYGCGNGCGCAAI